MYRKINTILLLAAIVLLAPDYALATSIKLISTECSLYGYEWNEPLTGEWSVSYTRLIEDHDDYEPYYYGGGSASVSVSESSIQLYTGVSGSSTWGIVPYGGVFKATALMTFQPIGSSYITIFTEGYADCGDSQANVRLINTSTMETLIDYNPFDIFGPYFPPSHEFIIPLNSFDIYSLEIMSIDFCGCDGNYVQYAASISGITLSVPEPATILLLGSGLLGLAVLRRRHRK